MIIEDDIFSVDIIFIDYVFKNTKRSLMNFVSLKFFMSFLITLTFLVIFSYISSGPIYKTTSMQHIAIYPGKFKFILVKLSPDSGRLH